MVMAAAVVPSYAEQQVINFFVNGGGFYDTTGHTSVGIGGTGCCDSYVGPAQSGAPGHLGVPINTHPAVTFQTTSSGNGAIREGSNKANIGTKGGVVTGQRTGDAYDGFGGVGLLGQNNFGGLTVTRDTEVTHGASGLPTALTTPFTNAGVPNAARFVETITNNTGSTIGGQFGFFNNLGSDAATLYVANNHGSLIGGGGAPTTGNLWVTSIQNSTCGSGGCDPVVTVVLGNNNYTATQVKTSSQLGGPLTNGNDLPTYLYPITVAPGQTVTIVLFSVLTASTTFNPNAAPNPLAAQQPDIALGGQMANLITNNGNAIPFSQASSFFVGLTPAQLLSIINFNFIFTMSPVGANINQTNVANAINTYVNNGGNLTNLFGLLAQSGTPLNNSLSQLEGQNSTGIQNGVFESGDIFLRTLLDPFNDGRLDNQIGVTTPLGYADEPKPPPNPATMALKVKPATDTFEARWTGWGVTYGGYGTAHGDATLGSVNTNTQAFGEMVGADYRMSRDTTVGFAIAGGGTNWGLAQDLGHGRSDVLQIGGFAKHTIGPWYTSIAAAFADHDVTTDRDLNGVTSSHYEAKFPVQSYSFRAEAGYRLSWQSYGLAPYAAVQSQWLHIPNYQEMTNFGDPTFALAFAHQNLNDTRTELGVWGDYQLTNRQTPVIVFGRAAWVHDYDKNRLASATFQTLPGASFVVNGAAAAADEALLSAGAKVFLTPQWSFVGKLDGEFGSGSQTYAATATLRKAW
jgi:uncharacterized protein with beta-barrel porin domain